MASVEELRAAIGAKGEEIRGLKASGGDVKGPVAELLALKEAFKEANGGVPFDPPKAKKEKKEKKAATPAGGGGEGGEAGELSKGAQKKAAKKAAKLAKKAALKGEEASPASGPAPAASAAAAQPAAAASCTTVPIPGAVEKPTLVYTEPVQPLASLIVSRLVDAEVAVMANRGAPGAATPQPLLLLPNGASLCGDVTIARFLARAAGQETLLGGPDPLGFGVVDTWCELCLSVPQGDAFNAALDAALATRTFLQGFAVSVADVVTFAALLGSAGSGRGASLPTFPHLPHLTRWLNHVSSMSAFDNPSSALRKLSMPPRASKDVPAKTKKAKSGKGVDQGGCPPLEGAMEGEVMTRFPPEPSGYMHLGHVKAVMLNDHYARRYKGRLLVRFDDTNPSKEKEEFEDNILLDLGKLGVRPDVTSHTSDFFPLIEEFARQIIGEGKAYMDNTPQEQMREDRMAGTPSKFRDTNPEENLALFEALLKGEADAQGYCLRAKIDMGSVNGTLRDPVLYRYNATPHHRTGDKYKAYPTYDFACPIVDSHEGVSHALRTTEYNDRDAQYAWLQEALGLRPVRIHAFARLNFVYTLLSKRKLQEFVDEGRVDGWFDPRFPTVQGLLRRGVQVETLREFILSQGASRRVVNMEWDKFWAKNKQALEPTARRYMAVFEDGAVPLELEGDGVPAEGEVAATSVPLIPKDPSKGERAMRLAPKVWVEGGDAATVSEGEEITLMRWMNVVITGVEKGGDGVVIRLRGRGNPEGNPRDTKLKVNWVAEVPEVSRVELVEYDHLITKAKLEETDDFHDFLTDPSEVVSNAIGDPLLNTVAEGDFVQLERRGFFRCDRAFGEEPARFIMVPDGKAKAMSALSSGSTHR